MTKVEIANLVILCAAAALVRAASGSVSGSHVPNEIIVKFREAADPPSAGIPRLRSGQVLNFRPRRIKPLLEDFQQFESLQKKNAALLTPREKRILARLKRSAQDARVPDLGRIYRIELDPPDGRRIDRKPGQSIPEPLMASGSIEEVLQAYRSDPNVEYAELNYVVSVSSPAMDPALILRSSSLGWPRGSAAENGPREPNDPLYSAQWSLDKIDAAEAWDISTGGLPTIVAVVDSGVDYNHRDLRDNMWVNQAELAGLAGVDDDRNGYVDDIYGYNFVYNNADPIDDHGHGTHCAGIIAAGGNNGLDIAGICRNTKIMAVKFLGSLGEGTTADAVLSIYYAVANGADIISCSWGSGEESRALQDAIDYAYSQGVFMVAAAGNDNSDQPYYPAGYPHVISVTATDSDDKKWSLSNYGDWIDIAAPGVDILSLRAAGTSQGSSYGQYTTFMSGTSMAAPHVAGACAFLLSANPLLTYAKLYDMLVKTTDPIAPGICDSNGRLNLFKAMHAVIPSRGYITLDHDYYARFSQVGILVADWDVKANEGAEVILMTKEGDSETLILGQTTPTLGIFTGGIRIDAGQPAAEDGTLQVSDGQAIAAIYFDANDSAGGAVVAMDSASADYEPARPRHVQAKTVGGVATIEIVTDEPTKATVRCGLTPGGPYALTGRDIVVSIYHSIKLQLLSLATDYFFVIDLVDPAGNESTADNGGLCYSFSTPEEFAGFHVPSIYSTIQAAIDDASDGDTVWVADGRYAGEGDYEIDFKGKAITVRSENGPENCTIDCQQQGRGFNFHSGEDQNTVLDGFTITNGNPGRYGGAIRCTASSPTIKNCIIVANVASDYGGGMYNCYKSNPTVINCVFKANSSESTCVLGNGGGMSNGVGSNPVLIDCNFTNNIASYSGGAMQNSQDSSPTITRCIFRHNSARWSGGAIFSSDRCSPVIMASTFAWNWAQDGGGGMCDYYNSNAKITNCIFSDNSTSANGGAMKNYESTLTLTNCTFSGNWAESSGGGIWNGPGSSVSLDNSILWDNGDSNGVHEAAQIMDTQADKTSTISYCCIAGWTGTLSGTGIISTDPRFVDPENGDYHLKSEGWRWDTHRKRWHYDAITSPCIDAGNPGWPLEDEPVAVPDDPDNIYAINLRINMGAYGGTAEASMPPHHATVLADITNDGFVTARDFSAQARLWMAKGDNLPADLNRDKLVDIADLVLLTKDWLKYRSGASPVVSIISPSDGALLQRRQGDSIEIQVDAWDFDGAVLKVEFFADSTQIGEDVDGSDGWKIDWWDFTTGSFSITARATDNSGVTTVSLPVVISVIPPR
jgi:hypothetical protein